jgi:copper homeostasis protein (lipoprotein)
MRTFIVRPLAPLPLLATLAGACGSQESSSTATPAFQPATRPGAAATEATVLRFSGTLPCADCSGIRTELTLTRDASGEPQTYQLRETYLGSSSSGGEKTFESAGRWTIERRAGEPETTVYRLDGGGDEQRARSFERVSEQDIRLLDRQGNRIDSQLNYTLTQVPLLAFPAPTAGSTGGPPAEAGAPVPAAMVTDLASGWPLTLRVGQDLTARLSVDRASGARWALRPGSDGGILTGQGPPTYESAEGKGVEIFQFKASKPGTTELTFELRSGSGGSPARTVSYQVTVP